MTKPIKVEADLGFASEAAVNAVDRLEPWMVVIVLPMCALIWRMPAIIRAVGEFLNQRKTIDVKHIETMAKLNNSQKSAISKNQSRKPPKA